jgi:hypothetical protein
MGLGTRQYSYRVGCINHGAFIGLAVVVFKKKGYNWWAGKVFYEVGIVVAYVGIDTAG